MTDKELQTLLKESSAQSADKAQDELFIRDVMEQVPSDRVRWGVVWTIRLVALAVGILVIVLFHPSLPQVNTFSYLLYVVQHLPVSTWTISGLAISAVVLFFCHRQSII